MHGIATMLAFLCLCQMANAEDKPSIILTISGPHTIPAGKKIEFNAVLSNESDHTIRIMWGETYSVQIHDERGKVPPLKPGLWSAGGGSGSTVDIEPGKAFTESVGGLEKYDLSAPGAYVVRVSRPLHIVNDEQGGTHSGTLESNQITITVVAKPPDVPVQLIFSPDHFTATSNSELRLPIRLINNSDEQLPCSQSTSTKIDERYLYDIRTSDGTPVSRIPGKEKEKAVIYPTTGALFCGLASGGSQDQVVMGLMGTFEMNQPGNYTVQVSLPDPDHPGQILGRSNVVTVTVKAPQ
jgi:hypothetical protein